MQLGEYSEQMFLTWGKNSVTLWTWLRQGEIYMFSTHHFLQLEIWSADHNHINGTHDFVANRHHAYWIDTAYQFEDWGNLFFLLWSHSVHSGLHRYRQKWQQFMFSFYLISYVSINTEKDAYSFAKEVTQARFSGYHTWKCSWAYFAKRPIS